MSNTEPFDPFAELNLDSFKNTSDQKPKLDKAVIREAAQKSKFPSRQAIVAKPKTIPKTFSLFPDDIGIIKMALRSYMEVDDANQASGSDVVRAALHEFSKKTKKEQFQLIEHYVGRGKKE